MSITNSMDSVFGNNSKAELDFDIIFDEDDSLLDMVSESGILSASFDDLHQTQDNAMPKDFGEADDDACGAKNPEGTSKFDFDDGINKSGKDYEDDFYGVDPLETKISSGKVNEDFNIDAYMESDDMDDDDEELDESFDIDAFMESDDESDDDTAGEDDEQDRFENESYDFDSFLEGDDYEDDDTYDDDDDSYDEGGDIDCLLDPKNGETPEGCCPKGSKECDYEDDFYGVDPLERNISSGKVQEGFDIDTYMESDDMDDDEDDDSDALDEAAGKVDEDDELITNVSKEKSSGRKSDLHYEYSDEDLIDAAINGDI